MAQLKPEEKFTLDQVPKLVSQLTPEEQMRERNAAFRQKGDQ